MATIGERMSPAPVTITADLSLQDAQDRMFQHGIRHLPVYDGGHLAGIVSQRDLATLSGFDGVDPKTCPVHRAMTERPFTCEPSTPVADVVAVMRDKKLGAAIVMEGGELKGVFTVIDALGVLSDLLER